MKKRLAAALAAVLLFASSTTAVAPSKPREIDLSEFRPINIPSVIVDTNGLFPTSAPPKRPKINLRAKPIIIKLTPPPPVTHNRVKPTVAGAKSYAQARLGVSQYSCLDQIAIHESNWNPFDMNSSSGAYGIGQALPASKMAPFGSDYMTNPITQIKWMIHYVDGKYGSACRAWAFWIDNRWY